MRELLKRLEEKKLDPEDVKLIEIIGDLDEEQDRLEALKDQIDALKRKKEPVPDDLKKKYESTLRSFEAREKDYHRIYAARERARERVKRMLKKAV